MRLNKGKWCVHIQKQIKLVMILIPSAFKTDLQEVEGGCGDWMELAQDSDSWWALVSTVMNFQVP